LDLLVEIDISGLEVVKGGKHSLERSLPQRFKFRDTLDTQLNVLADFQPKVPKTIKC
jgi:hypothetical protein